MGLSSTPVLAANTVDDESWSHFELLNDLRKEGFRCPGGERFAANNVEMVFDCDMWRAARLHSEDMAENNYFSHTSQDGRSYSDRLDAQGVASSASAENIAAGSSTAEGALNQWKTSDGHCRNMMNSRYTRVAIGYGFNQQSDYKHYWTEVLADADGDVDTSCYPASALVSGSIPEVGVTKTVFSVFVSSLF